MLALEPQDAEMEFGHSIEVIGKRRIDQRTGEGAGHGHGFGRQLVADHNLESSGNSVEKLHQCRSDTVRHPTGAVQRDIGRGLADGRRHGHAPGKKSRLHRLQLGRTVAEDRQALHQRLGIVQVRPILPGDLGDRSHHQGRRDRNLDRRAWPAKQPARAAGDRGQRHVQPRAGGRFPSSQDRPAVRQTAHGHAKRPLQGRLSDLADHGVGPRRQQLQQPLGGLSHEIGDFDQKARPLQIERRLVQEF